MNNSSTRQMQNTAAKYSQAKAMFAISRASFRSITRSPSAVIFTIAFPLVFIVVFGFIGGNRIKLDVGVMKDCDTSNVIFQKIANMPAIRLVHDTSDEALIQKLKKGSLDALLSLQPPDPATKNRTINLLTSKAAREKGRLSESVILNIVDQQNITFFKSLGKEIDSIALSRSTLQENMAELKVSEIEGREYKTIDFILPGQLGFSILSAGVFGTAFVFFSLRQTLVLKRFFATPIRRTYIVLGEAISRLVFQLLGSSIILLLGKFIFGFTLIHGWITVAEILVLATLGLIVFMGFGFVVSGIAKNENVIPPIANIVTLPQFLLSGTFFPVEAFPSWLQKISHILPLTYLNDAFRKVAFDGANLWDVSHQILIISIWGILIYMAAVKFFRWE